VHEAEIEAPGRGMGEVTFARGQASLPVTLPGPISTAASRPDTTALPIGRRQSPVSGSTGGGGLSRIISVSG
jgi:hypothetical protein